ncbi:DUF4880 domain-containing protein [Sphingomonas sp. AP4-R1]|uniref:FecR family protein n=1 Tax=Sphingomonas sp. AP4-R1 TaxID=2735134 RepID=UPI001493598E|nr:FecR domain-containing protein [Sphingomonas sp. AP4-R1]QJU60085.1 DUF4880 domain-containing protein [Sphingomonas sp. AP4-R1]
MDDGDEVRAQAAEWFARLKSVPVSRETLEQFFEWRRVGTHGAAFDAVERVWSAAGAAADRPSIQAATEAALGRGRRAGLPWWRAWRWPLAVAGLLIASGGGLSVLFLTDRSQAYATQVGEQQMITLEDGSKVTLDTDTRLTVHYSHSLRRISLERGQAFFVVAHASDRPFVVEAEGAKVRATGTRFEVRRVGDATAVTLVEGSVEVTDAAAHQPTRLTSGEQFELRGKTAPRVHRVDVAADTAWRRGRIILDKVTLADAVAEVNRYTRTPIALDAAGYAGNRFSGSFHTGDTKSFVTAATALLPLKADPRSDGRVHLVASAESGQN